MPDNIVNSNEFENKYSQIHHTLFRIALSILKDYYEAEDVVQQAATTGYQNYEKLKNGDAFKAWMTKILIHQCYHQLRNKKELTGNYWEDIEKVKDENELSTLENQILLIQKIEELDLKHKNVILLRFYSDLTIEEIAYTLDLPKGTIKSRLSRALLKLRHKLKEEDFNG